MDGVVLRELSGLVSSGHGLKESSAQEGGYTWKTDKPIKPSSYADANRTENGISALELDLSKFA